MSKSRLLSLIVVGIYLLIAYLCEGYVDNFLVFVGMSLPGLVCIWFGDKLWDYMVKGLDWNISTEAGSPRWLVKLAGWVLLFLLPHIPFIIQKAYNIDKVLETFLNEGY